MTIAESIDSAWTETTRWRIADEPDLVIGSVDGSVPGTDFGSAPVPITLPTGFAVLEPQTDDIRVFDSEGRWVRTLGRQGEGPDEFRSLGLIAAVRGDSVVGWDRSARKILTFPPGGAGPRYQATPDRMHAERFGWEVTGWLPDGRYLLRSRDDPVNRAPGRRLEMEWLVLQSPLGDSLAKFGPYPAYWTVANERGQVFRPLLGGEAGTRVADGTVWWAAPMAGFRFEARDVETGTRRVVTRPVERVPAPEGAREAGRRSELENPRASEPAVRAAMEQMWDDMPIVDTLPAFIDFLPSTDGGVWVNHVADPDDVPEADLWNLRAYASRSWTVFDSEGRWLGTVSMPAGFTPSEVDTTALLGTRIDDLGVAWIERYPILRP